MRASRDPQLRAARRLLLPSSRGASVAWLSGFPGILRVRTPAGELTCLPSELEALAPWIAAGGVGPMPVPEFWKAPWGASYRWTVGAWRRWPRVVLRGAA